MRPVTTALAVVWMTLGAVAPAAAQPEALLLYGFVPGCFVSCGGTVLRIAPDAPAILSSAVDRAAQIILRPYVTPEGRWLVWAMNGSGTGTVQLAVRDLVLGVRQTLVTPGMLQLGNPARPEVYLIDSQGVYGLGALGARRFDSSRCGAAFAIGVSGDGRRLVMSCHGVSGTGVFDVDSGQLVALLPAAILGAASFDGSAVYAVEQVAGPPRLRRYDVASGALSAEVPIPSSLVHPAGTVASVLFDADRNRVLVVSGEAVQAFDATSLALLASSPPLTAVARDESIVSVSFDDVSSRLYVVRSPPVGPTSTYVYAVIDAASLQRTLTVPDMPGGQFVALRRPRPPASAAASVTGAAVRVSWSQSATPQAVTRFVIEAGSAPGRSDIIAGLDVGLQTSLSASGVPPGTYYVRVRAGNYAGLGAPTNEVVVQVP